MMATQKILLPYNFTMYDQKAVDFVIRTFTHFEEAEITIFNAYAPVPEIETQDTSVMGKLKGNLSYLSQKIMQQESELQTLKQRLVQGGFASNRVQTIFRPRKKDVATEIADLAASGNFNIIVINHRPGKATRFFTGSVYNKVVGAVRNATVCIVSG
jgi:nucleotide-binding universal stress UspA family protein